MLRSHTGAGQMGVPYAAEKLVKQKCLWCESWNKDNAPVIQSGILHKVETHSVDNVKTKTVLKRVNVLMHP